MKFIRDSFSRRNFLKFSLGSLGAAISTMIVSSALGKVCDFQNTPRQTIGPFFPGDGDEVHDIRENLDPRLPIWGANDNDLTFIKSHSGIAKGQVVYIKGRVLGSEKKGCVASPGATIIMWNASASGRYNHKGDTENLSFIHPKTNQRVERTHDENFQYWGRNTTDKNGHYWFKTIVPGYYPIDRRGKVFRPPHLHFLIMAPGRAQLITQLYFRGDTLNDNEIIQKLNARDFILRDDQLSRREQESLIVDYKVNSSEEFKDGLVGEYDFIFQS
jgi:protocatechuate 3,4-dioxygenase beta subunit